MKCANAKECLVQINDYFRGKATGGVLVINSENYDISQEVIQQLQANVHLIFTYVSCFANPNGLPDIDTAMHNITGKGKHVLIGFSQALMLRSEDALEKKIDDLLEKPISGYAVIVLLHCEQLLQKFIKRDSRLSNKVIFIEGTTSPLPRIRLAKNIDECIGVKAFKNISAMLKYMEEMSEKQILEHQELAVITKLSPQLFSLSLYSVSLVDNIYDILICKYTELAGSTKKEYANDRQWSWLYHQLSSHNSLLALVNEHFGTIANLSISIKYIMEITDGHEKWLFWLALKVFGESKNKYLSLVIDASENVNDFISHMYLKLLEIDYKDSNFERMYFERKQLLNECPEHYELVKLYCDKLGIKKKNEIYYLTDNSDVEKYEFVRCLSVYDYSTEEINAVIRNMSKNLEYYMRRFEFNLNNTKVTGSNEALRSVLTDYFCEYKQQKLTNRIFPAFINKVNRFAIMRPYNKLSPRSAIVQRIDKKDTHLFFFDALGVEYLAFITAKCSEYGLSSQVLIGHCDLPSITETNKEFLQYFTKDNWSKIEALDEVKHHSQYYKYDKCEYPLHIFEELNIIDRELRNIQSMLLQGVIQKALIISDHGASRLAVRYGKESNSSINIDESGKHSGRCCPTGSNPHLDFCTYDNGFAVLANYERFKGGRRANVEVHGGASLEEVLVPIIILTKRPDKLEICFIEQTIPLNPRVETILQLYSNIPLKHPLLSYDGEFYEGEFEEDNKHIRFVLPKIRRKGTYKVEVYDGSISISTELEFIIEKKTHEIDLLSI